MQIPWVTILLMFGYAVLPDGKWRNLALVGSFVTIVFAFVSLMSGVQ